MWERVLVIIDPVASVRTDFTFQVVKNKPVMRLVRVGSGTSSLPNEFHRDWFVSHHPHPLHSRAPPNRKFRSRNDVVSKPRRPSFNSFAEICFHAGPEEYVPLVWFMSPIVGAVVIPIGFREGRRLVV